MVATACCGVRGSSNQGRPRPQTRDVVFWGIISITIQAVSGLHTPFTSQLRANHAQRCSREAGRGPERAKRAALRWPGHGPSGRGGAPAKVQVGGRFTPRKTQQTVTQQSGRRSGGREGPKDAFGGVGRLEGGGRARPLPPRPPSLPIFSIAIQASGSTPRDSGECVEACWGGEKWRGGGGEGEGGRVRGGSTL